jgi:hypothetical protein
MSASIDAVVGRAFTAGRAAVNPNPHGSGQICPHYFQRPISQKGLKQKNRQKLTIPRKKSAE